MRKIFYRDAVREALDEEMARDPMVMMIGEDIGAAAALPAPIVVRITIGTFFCPPDM